MEKSMSKIYRKFTSRMQARLLLVFCVITLLLVGLMGRLVYIVQVDGDRYKKHVLSRQSKVGSILPYKRGDITDRNGTVLATSELKYRLILDPKHMLMNEEDIPTTIEALNKSFGVEKETIQNILKDKSDSQYVTVLKMLDYDTVQDFKALMEKNKEIVGVWFDEEYIRAYPYNTLASDVLGFTSADNNGYWGIEEYYNEELNGTNGREFAYYDSNLDIERIVQKAVNGNSIVSTIDMNAQRIIQKHINEFNEEFGSKNIGVLIMNPNNGEVLAMASNQEYDLNNPRDLTGFYTEADIASMTEEEKMEKLNLIWKNDVISYGFEPGSTFKPVTIAAGLEESVIHENDTFYCDGSENVAGTDISCNKTSGHGEITLEQVLMYSCNDALMHIVAEQGKDIFYDFESRLGFGKKTGIDLPGEEAGIIIARDKLNPVELATSSFGQSFNTTILQLATAFSSLVNGGNYYQPHIVKKIVNDNGATVKEIDKILVRQTVSEKTSKLLQEHLYQTVEAGTAKWAKVDGYAIGGKTGTAQKFPRDAKTYIVSFLGCAPAINPEIVIYVWIDEPQNVVRQDDSSIATKLASKIMKELLPALGIYPDGDIDYLLPEKNTESGNDTTQNSGNQNANQSGNNTEGSETAGQNPDNTAGQNGSTENESSENGSSENGSSDNGEQATGENGQAENGDSTPEGTDDTLETNNDPLAYEFNADALD